MSKENALGESQTEGADDAPGAAPDEKAHATGAGAALTPEQQKAADEKAFQAKVDEAIKTRDEKVAGEKKTADEKAKGEYEKAWGEFKPEGKREEASLKEFTALSKELGLKPEQAAKFLALSDKVTAAAEKSRREAAEKGLDEEATGWVKELKGDKEFGGQKYTETLKLANKAFEKFADEATAKYLDATKLKLHPGLLKAFARVGAAMKDDTIAGTLGTSTGAPSREAQLRKLYPSMFKD